MRLPFYLLVYSNGATMYVEAGNGLSLTGVDESLLLMSRKWVRSASISNLEFAAL